MSGPGESGGADSGVTRLLPPLPPPSGASFLQGGRQSLRRCSRPGGGGRPAGRAEVGAGARGEGGGCFLWALVLAFGTAALWRMGWWREAAPWGSEGLVIQAFVRWGLGRAGGVVRRLGLFVAGPGMEEGELSWSALFAFQRSPWLVTEAAGLGPSGHPSIWRPRFLAFIFLSGRRGYTGPSLSFPHRHLGQGRLGLGLNTQTPGGRG